MPKPAPRPSSGPLPVPRLSRRAAVLAGAAGVAAWVTGGIGSARAQSGGRTVRVWTKKQTAADAKPHPVRLVEDVAGLPAEADVIGPYGGWAASPFRRAGTGFFTTGRHGGRWWLFDPEGLPFLSVGLNSVRGQNPGERDGGTLGAAAYAERFGGEPERWRDQTQPMLHEHGFNTTGSWSDDALNRAGPAPLAYCPNANFMTTYGERERGGLAQGSGHKLYPGSCIFAFDPAFPAFCRRHARQRLAATRDDPWLLGHFTDNELPFPKDSLRRFLALAEGDPGRAEAARWVAEHGDGEASGERWRGHVMDVYLGTVVEAIRAVDPNHLILGPRLYGSEKRCRPLVEAVGRHADVLSTNHYYDWTPGRRIEELSRWADRPVIVTEWYAKGEDSGMSNGSGAGWTVPTQADRGAFYQHYALSLLETRGCVGWHWFKYRDNDPTNLNTDPSNRDSNKGIVTSVFEPYPPLLEHMKELNRRVYAAAAALGG
ncbi:glycoside hydrolase 5 family protein [Phycisphaera mikurensis]|uniref:Agarase n=1 Tax=Phycisphaera mikurensis (strain NBRC 102666 / KCTC 22515 / FYK2301M01) TaxID=1142394 RepID=I0IEG4_PHYMF|nr:hypothetical protein [Phycisphaera mikurensis]MBB6441451.1 hypothetical protein [Phycisphaera mikurensis]BAM03652.1 hypothetical protein PSMK_14930 [Phycisphaera mikurensis NBRC 102666]